MDVENVSLGAALIAGLLSFASPCVLPLVPVYLGYITGTTIYEMHTIKRLTVWLHALSFVLGFGAVFALLGVGAGLLGGLLYPALPYITRVGGLVLIVFGLQISSVISIPFLSVDKRFEWRGEHKQSYGASALVGIIFAFGWTPCVGPVLTAILLLAADSQTALSGAVLLAVYALGLGLPFLAFAGFVELAFPLLRKVTKHMRTISLVSGVLLVLMGLLLVAGLFEPLIFWLNANLHRYR